MDKIDKNRFKMVGGTAVKSGPGGYERQDYKDRAGTDYSATEGERMFGEQRMGRRSSFASPMQRTWGQATVAVEGKDRGVVGYRAIGTQSGIMGHSGTAGYKDITGNVQGRYAGETGSGANVFEANEGTIGKDERKTIGGVQSLVGSRSSGGETRGMMARLDDHVFNGNMSDKDRMQVMRAMNRKYGAKGVLK
jgi:hypothetical protein